MLFWFRSADRKCIRHRNEDDGTEQNHHGVATIAIGPSNETEDPCIKTGSRQASAARLEHKTKAEVIIGLDMTARSRCQIALLSLCRRPILSCVPVFIET
jgi:hypothetical protein